MGLLGRFHLPDVTISSTGARIWHLLGKNYQYALAVAAIVAFFGYFIFFAHHLLDNHGFRMPWLELDEQVQNGRWLGPLIGKLHYGANIPVFMQGFSISIALISATIVAKSYNIINKPFDLFLYFSIILLLPINLAFYYYTFMTPQFFIGNLFAVLAFFILLRTTFPRFLLGALCLFLMMAAYQPALSVFAVLLLSGFIVRLVRKEGEDGAGSEIVQVRRAIIPAMVGGAAMIIGGAFYMLSIQYLPETSKAVDLSSPALFFDRGKEVVIAAFRHLLITQPDILDALNNALLILVIAAFVGTLIHLRRSWIKLIISVLAWSLCIIATKAIFLISDPGGIYQYRYNSGLIYFYGFCVALLLFYFRKGVTNWLAAGLVGLIVVFSFQADLVRQLVLLRGQERDLSTFNRILYRIESLPEFDQSVTYDLIRVGALPRYRLQLLGSRGRSWDEIGDGHMDYGEISDLWVDEDVFGLLGASFRLVSSGRQSAEAIRQEGLLEGRQPWPHESSVFIDDDRIIVFIR